MPIKKMIDANYRNTCGLCGGLGHNARSCSQLEPIANQAKQKVEDGFPLTFREQKALRSYQKLKNPKSKRTRRKPQCGFCGSPNHNRKTCGVLKEVRTDLYTANSNWRKAFLSKVKEIGFAEGALIQYTTKGLFGRGESITKSMGIIKETSMKDLTVLSSREWAIPTGHWRQTDYEARTKFKLYLNSRTDMLFRSHVDSDVFYFEVVETPMSDAHLLATHREWSNMGKIEILQPAQVNLKDKWTQERKINIVEWVIKNTSYDKLKLLGLEGILGEWL